MKKLLWIFALLLPLGIFAQGGAIKWMRIAEAVAAQKKEPRKIMIDVYTDWCGPCKMMMANTFTSDDVINYINKNYYAVKFNAESPNDVTFKGNTYTNPTYDPNKKGRNGVNEFSRALGVNAYPTLVYMDEDLNIIAPISGYRTPPQLELYLKFFAEDQHKTVKSKEEWDAYQANFKATFQ